MLMGGPSLLTKCLLGGRNSIQRHCIRYGSRAAPKGKDTAFRRRQYITAACCAAGGALVAGITFSTVPLGQLLCRINPNTDLTEVGEKIAVMQKINERILKITFTADTHTSIHWNFKPLQTDVKVAPGETALAFYTAKNPLDEAVVGISTYTVLPFEAGKYFHKLQCFCFEEQTLNPKEEVDLPVFFYIDPDFADDSKMDEVHDIVLSYTFAAAANGEPWYST